MVRICSLGFNLTSIHYLFHHIHTIFHHTSASKVSGSGVSASSQSDPAVESRVDEWCGGIFIPSFLQSMQRKRHHQP
jgi:hypothetical protein